MQSKENVASDGPHELGKVQKSPEMAEKGGEKKILIGWKAISEWTPLSTHRLKVKHGRAMQEGDFVFKSNIGNAGSPMVWSYPSFIQGYVIKVKQETGKF